MWNHSNTHCKRYSVLAAGEEATLKWREGFVGGGSLCLGVSSPISSLARLIAVAHCNRPLVRAAVLALCGL